MAWCREGLGKPADVAATNAAWRAEADQIGRFMSDRCVCGDYATVKAQALYQAYKQWAEASGERCASSTEFGKRLAERGYEKRHENAGNIYRGIGLRIGE
jgi:putative DNA primase/helicase